jgi:ligand-binding sensor domain-containing protein
LNRRTVRNATWAIAVLATLGAGAARSELPPGWAVHTFAGRIHDIEVAGGVVACATSGGLLFFHGASQTFAPVVADAGCTNGECLTSNQLTAVSRAPNGAYWIGTEAAGVVVFRPQATSRRYGRFFALSTAPGGDLLADSVTCIVAPSDDVVYAGTSRGIAQIDVAGAVESHNPEAARPLGTAIAGTRIHDIAADAQFVWVATDSGVSRSQRISPYAVQRLRTGLEGPETFTLEILNGVVHAGTSVGVFTWNEGAAAWTRIRNCPTCPPQNPPSFVARSIARRADNGWLFVGTDTGVMVYNNFAWGPQSPPPLFLLGNRRFEVMAAAGDTLYTCQTNDDGEGAFLERWITGPTPAGTWTRWAPSTPPFSEVRALSLAADGTLWTGTQIGGIGSLALDGTWCVYNGNDAVVRANMDDPEGHTSMLLVDRAGDVWQHAMPTTGLADTLDILTPSPVCNHAEDVWRRIAPDENGFLGRYWRAVQDGEGHRYFLSDGQRADQEGGIDALSASGNAVLNLRADILGTGGNTIGALAFDSASGPWQRAYLGANGVGADGLKLWFRSGQLFPPGPVPGPTNFTPLALPDSIDVGEYRDIVVVPGTRTLWVGTDNGVFEYDALRQQVVTLLRARVDARPGLLSGDIKDLQLDNYGNLWVATVQGVNRLRLADRAATGALTIDAFTTIGTIRDLNASSSAGQLYDPRRALAPLPDAKANALAYDSERDRLYIGTGSGVAVADVGALSRTTVLPLAQATLYPNPVRLDAGHTEVRLANISEPATITIYNLEGEEVCTVSDREAGDVVWSLGTPSCLESEGNFRVASGAYMVRITTASGSTLRTLVVVR